jgi:5'-3' exonuclease
MDLRQTENIIIDGNNLFMRAGYGFQSSKNIDKEQDDNDAPAAYTFLKSLRAMIIDLKPNKIYLTFDGRSKFRYDEYPAYKGDREKKKDDMVYKLLMEQLSELKEVCKSIGCYYSCVHDQEADDVMFVLSKVLPGRTTIVSGDVDMIQCCQEGKVIWWDQKYQRVAQIKQNVFRVTEAWNPLVKAEIKGQDPEGLTLDQFNLIKAISAGDDNIKGLPRYGWKTASKIVLGNHNKTTISELYDKKFPKDKCDPTYKALDPDEVTNLETDKLEEYLEESQILASEVIDRNMKLMVLKNNPTIPKMALEIKEQISKKSFDQRKLQDYLVKTRMNSILVNMNDFIRPFVGLS